MSQQVEWPAKITRLIADQIRHYRKRRGMSVQQLSDEVARLGLPIERPVLSNLELGRRHTISVAELLVIAAALRLPPLVLLFPIGRVETMEPLPGVVASPGAALRWAEHGHLDGATESDLDTAGLIHHFREHEHIATQWETAHREARHSRAAAPWAEQVHAGLTGSTVAARALADPAELLADAEDWEREEKHAVDKLRLRRELIRKLGVQPPELPPALKYLDNEPL
jgi:transcriptional regulator with XRE-family HTH domain